MRSEIKTQVCYELERQMKRGDMQLKLYTEWIWGSSRTGEACGGCVVKDV